MYDIFVIFFFCLKKYKSCLKSEAKKKTKERKESVTYPSGFDKDESTMTDGNIDEW